MTLVLPRLLHTRGTATRVHLYVTDVTHATQVLPRLLEFIASESLATEAWFIYERVLKCLGLVYACISSQRAPEDLVSNAKLAAAELIQLRQAAADVVASSPPAAMLAIEYAMGVLPEANITACLSTLASKVPGILPQGYSRAIMMVAPAHDASGGANADSLKGSGASSKDGSDSPCSRKKSLWRSSAKSIKSGEKPRASPYHAGAPSAGLFWGGGGFAWSCAARCADALAPRPADALHLASPMYVVHHTSDDVPAST